MLVVKGSSFFHTVMNFWTFLKFYVSSFISPYKRNQRINWLRIGSYLIFSILLALLTLFWFCSFVFYLDMHFSRINIGTNQHKWGHSIITFALRRGGRSIKTQTYANRERRGSYFNVNVHIQIFLIEHLVHKLLIKITRLLFSFIKTPALLKICSKKAILCR